MSQPDRQVIYRDSEGRELALSDLENLPDTIDWNRVGAEDIPVQAHEFHQAARNAGRKGDYSDAIKLLAEASRLAPDWPYPMYDAAFACLLAGDPENALKYYERVDALAPRGFFNSKVALATLRKEQSGELPKGVYLAFTQVEEIQNREERMNRLKELLETNPGFAPGWLLYATLEENEKLKSKAITRALELDPDQETKGMLLVLKALSLIDLNEIEEAVRLLCERALDPESTLITEHKAKTVLAHLVKQIQ